MVRLHVERRVGLVLTASPSLHHPSAILQAACKAREGLPLAACLLRLLYSCPALHRCAEAVLLAEGLLVFLAAPEQDGGPLGQGAAGAAAMLRTPDSAAASAAAAPGTGGSAAEVVPLEAADSALEGTALLADAPRSLAGSGGLHVATTAAQGLPSSTLLGLAHGAAGLHAPLTAALAIERLRQGTTVLPKEDWQALAAEVRIQELPKLSCDAASRCCGCFKRRATRPAFRQPSTAPAPATSIRPFLAGACCGGACRRRAGVALQPGGCVAGSTVVGGRLPVAAPAERTTSGGPAAVAGGAGDACGGAAPCPARGFRHGRRRQPRQGAVCLHLRLYLWFVCAAAGRSC